MQHDLCASCAALKEAAIEEQKKKVLRKQNVETVKVAPKPMSNGNPKVPV